ncbi:MAG: Zn-ribbon domain-containing OB-fold protein [Thermoproteota archaeon]
MSASDVPRHWRSMRERYRLLGTYCENCNSNFFPPRKICPKCRRKGKIKQVEFSGRGKVFSYTIVNIGSRAFEKYAPYIIGLIELEEGPRVISQIVDCKPEDVYIGMEVEACFRKLFEQGDSGIISYGFKFRPVDDSWMEYYKKLLANRKMKVLQSTG